MQSNIAEYSPYEFTETLARMDDILSKPLRENVLLDGFDQVPELHMGEWGQVRCCVMCILWQIGKSESRDIDVRMDVMMYNEVCHILLANPKVKDIVPQGGKLLVLMDAQNKDDWDNVLILISKLNALRDVVCTGFKKYEGATVDMGIGALYSQAYVLGAEAARSINKEFIWETPRQTEVIELAREAMKGDNIRAIVTENLYQNMKQEYQKYFTKYPVPSHVSPEVTYNTHVYNIRMHDWATQE